MRILFVGNLSPPSRSQQRFRTLSEMGHEVEGLPSVPLTVGGPGSTPPGLVQRVARRAGLPLDVTGVNRAVREAFVRAHFDVLWVEKALALTPATLRFVRRSCPPVRILGFCEDDMFARANGSFAFRASLPQYDVLYTTKSFHTDPQELPGLGARRVVFVPKTYDPTLHRPVQVSEAERVAFGAEVGFIGTFEPERAQDLARLAEEVAPVRVWGNGWEEWRDRCPRLRVEGRAIYGEDYVKALCATSIQLGFLRKASRDLHTDRSVEIPACGAFLLAQRTEEHRALFEEDREAVFFDSFAELADKVDFYLKHEDARQAIARRGRTRALAAGYSHREALERMLSGGAVRGRVAA